MKNEFFLHNFCQEWTHSNLSIQMNSLRPSDAIWRHRNGSTLVKVMLCCLMAPSHYLNQCWLHHQWSLVVYPYGNLASNVQDIYHWSIWGWKWLIKITAIPPNDQRVKKMPHKFRPSNNYIHLNNTSIQWNFNEKKKPVIFIPENSYGDVHKMSAILWQPQCVNCYNILDWCSTDPMLHIKKSISGQKGC